MARPDATTSYLKAIVAARSGQDSSVLSNLKDAFAKDSSLKQRAAKDLEFATASYYFRLIALMGFLEEQPQFVGTTNATYTVSEGAFIALG